MPKKMDRTDYVYEAAKGEPSRFKLCRKIAKAVRMVHLPGVRIEDTTNMVLTKIGSEPANDGT